MNSSEYIEVEIHIVGFTQEAAEIIEAELGELPYDSFMTEEIPGGEPVLKAYIQKELYDPRALKLVLSGLEYETSFSATLIPPQNWNAAWESSFTPIVVDRKVTVKAPFHKDLRRTRFNVIIDPQMAFGTGHHETTHQMISAMLRYEVLIRGKAVLDMGCGTGVLGILAAKMRARKIFAVDIDAVAAQSAFYNAHTNRVSRLVETAYGDASLIQAGHYDVILANIHKNIIIRDLRTYAMGLTPGGLLLTSGFYDSDEKDIITEATACGLSLSGSTSLDGWSCLAFRKQISPQADLPL